MSDPPPPVAARPSWLGHGPAPGPAANSDKIVAITAPDTVYPEFWPGSGAAIFSTDLCTLPAKKLGDLPFPPVIVRGGHDKIKAVADAAYVWVNKYKWQSSCIFPSTIPVEWTIEDLWDEEDIHVEGKVFCTEMLQFLKGMAFYWAHKFSEGLRKHHPDRMPQLFNEMQSIGRHPQHDLAIVDKIFNINERAEFPRIFLWHVGNITFDYLVANNMKMTAPLASIKQLPTLTEHEETITVAVDATIPDTKANILAKTKAPSPAQIEPTISTKAKSAVPKEIEAPIPTESQATLSTKAAATTPTETELTAPKEIKANASRPTEAKDPSEVQVTVPTNLDAADAVKSVPSLMQVAAEPSPSKTNRKIKRSRPAKLIPTPEPSSPAVTPATETIAAPTASDHASVHPTPRQHHQQTIYPGDSMGNYVGPKAQPSNMGHSAYHHDPMAPNYNPRDMGFSSSNRSRAPSMRGENVNRVPSGPYAHQPSGPASNLQPSHAVGNNVPVGAPLMVPPNTLIHYGAGPMMMPPNMPNQYFEPSQMHGVPGQLMQMPMPNQGLSYMYHPQAVCVQPGVPLSNAGFYSNPPHHADPCMGMPHHAGFNVGYGEGSQPTPKPVPTDSSYRAGNMLYDPYNGSNRKFSNPSTSAGGNKSSQASFAGPAGRSRKISTPGNRPAHTTFTAEDPAITGDRRFGCHHHWIGPENETVKELFVGDLPEGVDEHELLQLFEQKVGIQPIRVEIKGSREIGGFNPRWHGFVGFSTTADAKKALRIRDQNPTLREGSTKVTVLVPKNCFLKSLNPFRRLSVTSSMKGPNDERVTPGITQMTSHDEEITSTKKHLYSPQDARSDLQRRSSQKEVFGIPALSGSPEAYKSGRRHGSPPKKKAVKQEPHAKMTPDHKSDVVAPGISETLPAESVVPKAKTPSEVVECDPSVEQPTKESETVKSEQPEQSDVAVTVAIIPPAEEIVSDEEAKNDNSFHSAQESLTDNAVLGPQPEHPDNPILAAEKNLVPAKAANEVPTSPETVLSSTDPSSLLPTQLEVSSVEGAQATESAPETVSVADPKIAVSSSSNPASLPPTKPEASTVGKVQTTHISTLASPGLQQTGSLSPFAKPSKSQQRKEKEARKKQQKKAEAEKAKASKEQFQMKSDEPTSPKPTAKDSPIKNKKLPPALPNLKLHPYNESSGSNVIITGLSQTTYASDTASIASSATLQAEDTAILSPSADGYVTALQTPMVPAAHTDVPQEEAPKKKKKKNKNKNKKKSNKVDDTDIQTTQVTGAIDDAPASTVGDSLNVNTVVGNVSKSTNQMSGSSRVTHIEAIQQDVNDSNTPLNVRTGGEAGKRSERAESTPQWSEASLAEEIEMYMRENESKFPQKGKKHSKNAIN